MTGIDEVGKAIAVMHQTFAGERMVLKALEREAWKRKEPIPVSDAEEALCILLESGWTWQQICFINS
jgi:hypothetical protein